MATILEIPLFPEVPLYTERVTLDGRDYILRFDYAQREDRWFMSVDTPEGTTVRRGIKVTANYDVLKTCVHPDRPLGALLFLDVRRVNGAGEAPGFQDMGRTVKLVYIAGDLSVDNAELAQYLTDLEAADGFPVEE